MVSKLKRLSGFIYFLFIQNKLLSLVITYQLVATVCYNAHIMDWRIPCLFTFVFDTKCYGCGLSESVSALLKLNIVKAVELNVLIVPLTFYLCYYILVAYKKYAKDTIAG